ncbi:MAG: carbon storage regulator [Planctomycetota bacterium]
MLVLSRKESEKIMLGESIVLTIVRISGDRVRLGIEAPSDMLILRKELDPIEDKRTGESKALPTEDQKKAA